MKRLSLISVIVFCLATDFVSAAEISGLTIAQQGVGLILVKGDIEPGDGALFNRIAQQYNKAAVLLASNGGNLQAGIEIGRTIRLRNFSTGVAPGTLCASACAMAWLGGTSRYMSANSRVGFHAAYVVKNGVPRETGLGNAVVGAYVTQLGFPMSAVIYITTSGPDQMTWLNADDARRVGIDVHVLDISTNPSAANLQSAEPNSSLPSKPEQKAITLPDDQRWIIVSSHSDLTDAIAEAQRFKARFGNTAVLLSSNGKYAVTLGRFSLDDARQAVIDFKPSGIIPQDAYISQGTRFIALAWQ